MTTLNNITINQAVCSDNVKVFTANGYTTSVSGVCINGCIYYGISTVTPNGVQVHTSLVKTTNYIVNRI